jgi:type I restriction-modification system DNA methylase subunit
MKTPQTSLFESMKSTEKTPKEVMDYDLTSKDKKVACSIYHSHASSPVDWTSIERAHTSPSIQEAEGILADLADYVYAHTSLKPMSKTLFFVSRCLLAAASGQPIKTMTDLCHAYELAQDALGKGVLTDDYSFRTIVSECENHLTAILKHIERVRELTRGTDALGLAFNTLLRGKWESGEGLGTFLTPEEIVGPMVEMALTALSPALVERIGDGATNFLFGDICGGTGRFVYYLARSLEHIGVARARIEGGARLFDQSSMAVDFARLNFYFEGLKPSFTNVSDSLTSPDVTDLKGRFAALATNPPFGIGKYRWSKPLARTIPLEVLKSIGMCNEGNTADPALLFLFRNLDLLADGGVLAIVLPDGLMHAAGFVQAMRSYEQAAKSRIEIMALISLPVAAFVLGGTVAKTSFLVVRKGSESPDTSLFVASAKHIGFLKRGNRRVSDPAGNQLVEIANEFRRREEKIGTYVENWRHFDRLAPAEIFAPSRSHTHTEMTRKLKDLVVPIRSYTEVTQLQGKAVFHVSVLDVDETGLIDVVKATLNSPVTRSLECCPGDILISCLNPKIWRVAVIPDIDGRWSCSSEFVVLRPKPGNNSWAIAIALHHRRVCDAVQAMAGGTSSSRQRVPKDRLLALELPVITVNSESLEEHVKARDAYYRARLREARAYEALHQGEIEFMY